MKYGIFSDIHANLEAFTAVREVLQKKGVDQYVFLGDLVGYGADPKACVDILKNMAEGEGCLCVAGNHDHAVCGLTRTDHFILYAIEAIDWTRKQMSPEDLRFLSGMPLVRRAGDFTAVHASLVAPQEWQYIVDIDDAYPNFKLCESRLCFIGHSHKPIVFSSGDMVDWSTDTHVELQDGYKYIINIGSVGQPRDGNPKAACAVYDTGLQTVEIVRVDYDIAAAQKKIRNAGLPKVLADRLAVGK